MTSITRSQSVVCGKSQSSRSKNEIRKKKKNQDTRSLGKKKRRKKIDHTGPAVCFIDQSMKIFFLVEVSVLFEAFVKLCYTVNFLPFSLSKYQCVRVSVGNDHDKDILITEL